MADLKFAEDARFWDNVYSGRDSYSRVIQLRHTTALTWAEALDLPSGSATLEIGCGGGRLSLALREQGFALSAMDQSMQMVRVARKHLSACCTETRTLCGNAHNLPFPAGSFELVVALGVLGWLERPLRVMSEVARVLVPGGYFLVSAANRGGLAQMFDPFQNPVLAPTSRTALSSLKRLLYPGVVKRWPQEEAGRSHTRSEVKGMLRLAGFGVERWAGVGFGPFAIHGHPVVPDVLTVPLQYALHQLSENGCSVLQKLGTQLLFLARKPVAVTTAPV